MDSHPGTLLEDKIYTLSLHYRLAPEARGDLEAAMEKHAPIFAAEKVTIQHGKSVIDAKPKGIDKGVGLRALMRQPPFRDRMPVFGGDDTTDMDVFHILPELGGHGFSVGRTFDGVWIMNSARPMPCVNGFPFWPNRGSRHERAAIARSGLDWQLPHRRLGGPHGADRVVVLSRFDSDPLFCRLIAGDEEKGFFDVVLEGFSHSQSHYERNTATVVTLLSAKDGATVRITDFAPRFRNFDRILRPPQLMRRIEPVSGIPRITIRLRPTARITASRCGAGWRAPTTSPMANRRCCG